MDFCSKSIEHSRGFAFRVVVVRYFACIVRSLIMFTTDLEWPTFATYSGLELSDSIRRSVLLEDDNIS